MVTLGTWRPYVVLEDAGDEGAGLYLDTVSSMDVVHVVESREKHGVVFKVHTWFDVGNNALHHRGIVGSDFEVFDLEKKMKIAFL